jgi:hypothetical protein
MNKKEIPVLKYYDVKVTTMLPATLTYKILAESAEQAVDLMKGKQPNTVSHKLIGRKDKKITVYEAGTSLIRFIKNLLQ